MKVLVTGGTGFVGSHAVEAMVAAGHEVRLLARSHDKVARVMGQRDVAIGDVVIGDMSDRDCVRMAMRGCDAVVHAAASVAIGRGENVYDSNVAGVSNVVGTAVELGLDPVVFVSSVATMFPPPGDVITVNDPITNLETDYGRSKAFGERLARKLQAEGAPVAIVYPTGVYGPDDPGVGANFKGLRDRLKFGWFITTGGIGVVDVRDLAQIVAATLAPRRGPRRFMAGGHFLTWAEEADLCQEITGHTARRIPARPGLVGAIGHTVDFIKKVVPSFDYPLTHEASQFVTRFVPCDSRQTVHDLGIDFRPVRETLEDSIRWLHERGELTARYVPKLQR